MIGRLQRLYKRINYTIIRYVTNRIHLHKNNINRYKPGVLKLWDLIDLQGGASK